MRYFKFRDKDGEWDCIYELNDSKTMERFLWSKTLGQQQPTNEDWREYFLYDGEFEQEITDAELFLYML